MALHSSIERSVKALSKDKRFAKLIKKHGLPDLSRRTNHFQSLARSIIHQQVSGAAAATIYSRFVGLFNPASGSKKRFPSPAEVSAMPIRKLRSAGLSRQ